MNRFKKIMITMLSMVVAFVMTLGSVSIVYAGNIDDPELWTNFNGAAVGNDPNSSTTTFTLDDTYLITSITDYHWNDGQGADPGKITILQDGNKIGSWKAEGRGGSGAENVNWDIFPDIVLGPGSYEIKDSDKSTWSVNGGSNGDGFILIRGVPSNDPPVEAGGSSSSGYSDPSDPFSEDAVISTGKNTKEKSGSSSKKKKNSAKKKNGSKKNGSKKSDNSSKKDSSSKKKSDSKKKNSSSKKKSDSSKKDSSSKKTDTKKKNDTDKKTDTQKKETGDSEEGKQLKKHKPSRLPNGIIKGHHINFKGYNDSGMDITGYQFAVKEAPLDEGGEGGDWKKVKTTQDHTDMSGKFGSLKQGGHYYYKYRLYKTIDDKDYYSKWSDYMIDDYTGWE